MLVASEFVINKGELLGKVLTGTALNVVESELRKFGVVPHVKYDVPL
ncbi:UNVERIFIED_ORG: hypothetical protein [Escherichia phage CMSTMSU]